MAEPVASFGAAMRWYEEAAERGDAAAQFYLGYAYEAGLRGPIDRAKAIGWYRRAAAQGHVGAQFKLAVLLSGKGEAGADEAVRWYKAAAASGFAPAQYNLGLLYDDPAPPLDDPAAAARWYEAAARQGVKEAAFNLGLIHVGDVDALYDPVQAWAWMDIAAERGVSKARAARDRIGAALSSMERDAAERLAGAIRAELPPAADPATQP